MISAISNLLVAVFARGNLTLKYFLYQLTGSWQEWKRFLFSLGDRNYITQLETRTLQKLWCRVGTSYKLAVIKPITGCVYIASWLSRLLMHFQQLSCTASSINLHSLIWCILMKPTGKMQLDKANHQGKMHDMRQVCAISSCVFQRQFKLSSFSRTGKPHLVLK